MKQAIDNLIEEMGSREYEVSLLNKAKKEPNNVINWQVMRTMSRNSFNKSYFLSQMMDCISRKGNIVAYSQGIVYTHKIKREDLTSKLLDEAVDKHPVTGRIMKLLYYVPLSVHLSNK
jgi:hypothetical protein